MNTVYVRQSSYEYDELRKVIFEMLDATAGERINSNSRVLIKPNLLAPAPPEKAIVTHPLIVKAAAEYVLAKGAKPQISDSPAVGSFEKILKESGTGEALKGLNVHFSEFKKSVSVDAGKPFHRLEIAEDALKADVVINLPKLKTHTQMLLTLGVKNMFGCVVGRKKPEWHLRAGTDRELFARLLVRIYGNIKPAVTIIDGILAMEGQGPGESGTPKELGYIIGSTEAVSADTAVCRMLGIASEYLLTNKIAFEEGITGKEIELDGSLSKIQNFILPEMVSPMFGPRWFHGFMRRHLTQRPTSDDDKCRLCGDCWNYCPADAISQHRKAIRFDYDKCIRCYCCIEVCPYGALEARETLPGRITRRLLKV
jgi:uncharacterized protein (DUF362 family)/Pyruvate/2-oxoacid:ferredoxin oxidoreductase delta subunit